jgi:hypothetical protein
VQVDSIDFSVVVLQGPAPGGLCGCAARISRTVQE